MRRIGALVEGLPPDSALARAQDDQPGWTQSHELAATHIEVFDHWQRQNLIAKGAKKHKLPKPIQIPRPGRPTPVEGSAAERVGASLPVVDPDEFFGGVTREVSAN